ncbi:MAG: lysylphosphatidylglycerol synthase domain-containing protein [Gemmatimonadota bacterium]|nr:lysylphosphatidylglycerol synthase domain-containing protein [Gemmatimonadota bacterium]
MTLSRKGRVGSGPGGSRRWGVAVVKVAVAIALTWLILRAAGFQLAESASSIDWTLLRPDIPVLLLSVAALFAAFALQGWLWARLLIHFGGPPVRLTAATAMILVANMGRYIPGKIFQLAGLALLAKREGISGVQAGVAAVTGQLLNLLAAAMVGGWAAYAAGSMAEGAGLAAGLAVVLGAAVLVGLGGAGRMLRWLLRRSGHEGEVALPGRRILGLCLAGYIVGWAAYGLAFFWLARGCGLDVPAVTAITAFSGAYFVGYISLAPGGIGVREGGLYVLLVPVLGAQASLMLAGLQRVWITIGELLGAVGGAVLLKTRERA